MRGAPATQKPLLMGGNTVLNIPFLFIFRLKSGFKTDESNGENKTLKSNSKDWLH
jgi:hypothetical protein